MKPFVPPAIRVRTLASCALTVFSLAACGEQPAGLLDGEQAIVDRIRQVRELRRQAAVCWPGFDAPEYDTPLLYYTDSVCYAVNPTRQFRDAFGARIACRDGEFAIYKTALPDTLRFHMQTQVDFEDSTAYNHRMPFLFCSSPEITVRTIPDVTSDSVWLPMVLHEYTHGFQFRQRGFIDAFGSEMPSVPQKELTKLYKEQEWFRKAVDAENEALLTAIAAENSADRDACICRFHTLRKARKERMSTELREGAVRSEEIYELMESMARYVEADAGFRLGSYTEADDWLFRTDRSSYFYATGYNLLRLLDRCGTDKSRIFTGRLLPLETFLTTTEKKQ